MLAKILTLVAFLDLKQKFWLLEIKLRPLKVLFVFESGSFSCYFSEKSFIRKKNRQNNLIVWLVAVFLMSNKFVSILSQAWTSGSFDFWFLVAMFWIFRKLEEFVLPASRRSAWPLWFTCTCRRYIIGPSNNQFCWFILFTSIPLALVLRNVALPLCELESYEFLLGRGCCLFSD